VAKASRGQSPFIAQGAFTCAGGLPACKCVNSFAAPKAVL
jgi:hypothetical protein